jgi:hypothetical protein
LAVFQGTVHTISFLLKASGSPIDITGWTFSAKLKDNRADSTALVTLTSANGGFVIADATAGRLQMVLSAVQTAALPTGRIVFDVLRTDGTNSPVYIAGGSFQVKASVTTYTPPVDEDDETPDPGEGPDEEPIVLDLVPEPFAFADLSVSAKSTVYESDVIVVDGTTPGEPVTMTITGGEYAIGVLGGTFGAWASAATTVQDGDIVKLRTTSAAVELTAVPVVLTIGGVSDTWTVTTEEDAAPADVTPDAFTFVDVTDVTAGAVTESNAITVTGTTTGAPVAMTITGGEYSVNSGAWASAARDVIAGDIIKVRGTALAAPDPDILNLSFLSGFDGAHGGVVATDESPDARTITIAGTTAQTRTSKFYAGTASYFNGTDGKLTVADHADFDLGSGAFTMEGWFAWAVDSNSCDLISKVASGGQSGWRFRYSTSSNKLILEVSADGTALTTVAQDSGTWSPVLSQWYHLSADFDGTTYRIYRNGVVVGSGTVLVTAFDGTAPFCVGNNDTGLADFNGYFDEVALWKGVAKHGGAAFVPPVGKLARDGATGVVDVALTIGGVSDTFSITTIAAPAGVETIPDAFTFNDLTQTGFGVTFESNTITVAGTNAASPMTITGGEYSKNNGAWLTTATSVLAGDTVKVRGVSGLGNSATTEVVLTIGGVSDTFSITTAGLGNTAQSVIFDCDVGGDLDDAVSFAILVKKHLAGEINLLLVNTATDGNADAPCVRAILDHYECEDVTVSAHQGAIVASFVDNYATTVRDRFGDPLDTRTNYPADTATYRSILSQVPDSSVKIIVVGGHTSIAALLASPADAYSTLTGSELIAAKVSTLYVMGGSNLNPESGGVDYNLSRDIPAAQSVATSWPTPVVWHGSEVATNVLVSPPQGASGYHDPIKFAYESYETSNNLTAGGTRPSWDTLTALYATDANHRTQYDFYREDATVSVSGTGVATSTATAGNDSIVEKAVSDATFIAEIHVHLDTLLGVSRTNLLARSNDFDALPWVKTASTFTTGHADPLGGTDAYLFAETAVTSAHVVASHSIWSVNSTSYAAECYAKMGTRRYVQLVFGSTGFGTTKYANFDLQLGVVGSKGAGAVTSWIIPVAGQAGWYRIGFAGTATSSGYGGNLNIGTITASNSTRFQSHLGATSNTFYMYGMQMAVGTATVPYVSTMPAAGVVGGGGTFDTLAGPTHPILDPNTWPYWDISGADIPLHADSAAFTTEWIATKNTYYGHVGINYAQYTAPIYVVDDTVPESYVYHRNSTLASSVNSGLQATMTAVPVPSYAQRSVGTDRQLTIYRPSTDECWELFNTKDYTVVYPADYGGAEATAEQIALRGTQGYEHSTYEGYPLLDPNTGLPARWITRWGGKIEAASTKANFPKPPGHGQMASGVPVIAQMVLNHEMATALATPGYGSLPHSIKFGHGPTTAHYSLFCWPAVRSDGNKTHQYAIRYGQRFRLNPLLDLDDYPSLHPMAKVVFRTLQKHGGVVADRGGLITMAFESRQRWLSQGEPDPWAAMFNGTPSYDVMDGFPYTELQWLPFDYGKPGTTYAPGNAGGPVLPTWT